MNRTPVYILSLLALCFVAALAIPTPPASELMVKKTERAQALLKYLALGDVVGVKEEAIALRRLTENAGFANRPKDYKEYGEQFLRAVNDLAEQADKHNLPGCYYQFNRITSICFSCHDHVRGVQSPGLAPIGR